MNIPSLGINHVASEERVKVLEAQLKEVNMLTSFNRSI